MTDQKTDDGATGPIEFTWGAQNRPALLVVQLKLGEAWHAQHYQSATAADLVATLQANAALRAEVLKHFWSPEDLDGVNKRAVELWKAAGEPALREKLRLAESLASEQLDELRGLYAAFQGSGHSPKNPREATQAIGQMHDAESELVEAKAQLKETAEHLGNALAAGLHFEARVRELESERLVLLTDLEERCRETGLNAYADHLYRRRTEPQQPARPATETEAEAEDPLARKRPSTMGFISLSEFDDVAPAAEQVAPPPVEPSEQAGAAGGEPVTKLREDIINALRMRGVWHFDQVANELERASESASSPAAR